mgnify:CR=1 FL=1
MNGLLTGGIGFSGSHTAVALSQLGHQVVRYHSFSSSVDTLVYRLGEITGLHMLFV